MKQSGSRNAIKLIAHVFQTQQENSSLQREELATGKKDCPPTQRFDILQSSQRTPNLLCVDSSCPLFIQFDCIFCLPEIPILVEAT
jgi:hypothetical protein